MTWHPNGDGSVTVWPDASAQAVTVGAVLTIDDLMTLLAATEPPPLAELADR